MTTEINTPVDLRSAVELTRSRFRLAVERQLQEQEHILEEFLHRAASETSPATAAVAVPEGLVYHGVYQKAAVASESLVQHSVIQEAAEASDGSANYNDDQTVDQVTSAAHSIDDRIREKWKLELEVSNVHLTNAVGTITQFFDMILGLCWRLSDEPVRRGRLADFTRSLLFNIFVNLVVLVNTTFIIVTTVRQQPQTNTSMSNHKRFILIEFIFWCVFAIELVIKLAVHRIYFFTNKEKVWNWLDFVVLLSACVDVVLIAEHGQMDVLFLRSLRIVRLCRLLRTVRALRTLRILDTLRTILDSILGSLQSLVWSLILVFSLLVFFGILFVQLATYHLEGITAREYNEKELALVRNFGTLSTAVLSLFNSTTGGDWLLYFNALTVVGPEAGVIFLFFFCFFQIAIWNIVSSVFIEKAMREAASDPERVAQLHLKQENNHKEYLKVLLQKSNINDDDCISRTEFLRMFHDPVLRSHLAVYGLDVTDPRKFWEMIATTMGKEELAVNTLASAFTRLGGPATRAGLYTLKHDLCQMMVVLESMMDKQIKIHQASTRLSQGVQFALDRSEQIGVSVALARSEQIGKRRSERISM